MSPLRSERSHPPPSALGMAGSALGLGVPAAVLVCALFGLGLRTPAPAPIALAAALALALLPVAAIAAAIRHLGAGHAPLGRRFARTSATWIWTLAVLLAIPSFAPGLRSQAAREGADALFARFLGPLREPARGAVGALAGLIGGDGQAPGERDALASTAAPAPPAPPAPPERTDPPTRPPRAVPERRATPARADAAVELAYRGDGREIDVEVALEGPDFGERFRMIFDTGASYTTITPQALDEIGVRVPADAPIVTLTTAGGRIEAPLVLLDAVWLGDAPVEWVTVAACPSCTAPGRAGLLGLNVSSQFRVEIDYDRKRIHLEPSPGDRRHDVRPWIDLSARGVQHGAERLEFEVTLANRAPRGIDSATVEIDCGESGVAVEIANVPAHAQRTTSLTLPGAPSCASFRLDLLSATWVLDRF